MASIDKNQSTKEIDAAIGLDQSANKPTPEWVKAFEGLVKSIDPRDAEQAIQDLEEFIFGDATWAKVQGIPQQTLYDVAERGYLKFQSGRFREAEIIFKGLSLVEHKTAYYHTALGAIYQKQQKFFEALTEYTVAIELDPNEITAYVNRGEIYFRMGAENLPQKDFDQAIKLDPQGKDPWANRARFLRKQLLQLMNIEPS
jgi:Flp pilus assembly protein TadD